MRQTRDVTYDIMKGIGILLVLVGHIGGLLPIWLAKFIGSFHMPLFFMIAGHFAAKHNVLSWSDIKIMKSAKRLLLPYAVTFGFILLISLFATIMSGVLNFEVSGYEFRPGADLIRNSLSLVLMNADPWPSTWGVFDAGPMWFIVALFWAKILYDVVRLFLGNVTSHREEFVLVVCTLISLIGYLLHRAFPILPFSLIQGLFALIYIGIGGYMANKKKSWWLIIILFLCWLAAICDGGNSAWECRYGLWGVVGVLGACGGVWMTKTMSVRINCRGEAKCSVRTSREGAHMVRNQFSLYTLHAYH